jgi:alpha-galactosidase
MLKIIFISVLLLSTAYINSLNNGLALTPPMGWISWAIFQGRTWCEKYPDSCLNEQNVKAMADRMATDGYKELGYQYVNIDDCWSEHQRDSSERLVADKKRFPNGMKALADYVHSKGLKFGLYGAVGNETCAG